MPFNNLGKSHFTEEKKTLISEALSLVINSLSGMGANLTPRERTKFGKVGPQQEIIIGKVREYQINQPENCSPDIDWEEFHLDYKDRKTTAQLLTMVKSIEEALMNIRILGDYDNYKAALTEYRYTQYRNHHTADSAFLLKADEIRQFFPKTGKKSKPKKDE